MTFKKKFCFVTKNTNYTDNTETTQSITNDINDGDTHDTQTITNDDPTDENKQQK